MVSYMRGCLLFLSHLTAVNMQPRANYCISIWRKVAAILLCCFLCNVALLAQPSKATFFSLQDGLSNQQVLDIAHDDDGFVWIATELGLNRFASKSFVSFFKADEVDGTSVNSNEINTLLYDRGKLYIGTRADGLNVLDLQTNRFTYYQHDPKDESSIATNDITDILKGSDGYLWLATYHQGLQRFDSAEKSFLRYNQKALPQLPENGIWSLAEDQQGMLYMGHVNKGVSIFDRKTKALRQLTVQHGLPDGEVKALFCDNHNNVWIGTRRGLAVYHPRTGTIEQISLASKSKNKQEPFVYSIKEVGGAIYVGAESSQLFILHPQYHRDNQVQAFVPVDAFQLGRGRNSSVQDIEPDRFGNIWMGLYGGGIGFVSHMNSFFSVFPSRSQGVPAGLSTVSGIVEGTAGHMWLTTEGDGLVALNEAGILPSQHLLRKGLSDDFLLAAFKDSRGDIWAGLQQGGVAIFDEKSATWRQVDLGEQATEVRAMMEDRKGHIWLAAQQGLFIYDPLSRKVQKLLVNRPMLGDYAPRAIVEDKDGKIWVGTYGQGLYVFSEERKVLHKFSTDNGLKSNTINHLFRDRDNNIWVATNEGIGFHSANNELDELTSLVPEGGNAWANINALAEDRNGNIWCSSKSGLLRYLQAEKKFLTYDAAFGIPLGGFINNSVGMDRNGRLYFGMHEGVCYFDPAAIPIKLKTPPIRMSRFMVFQSGESQSPSLKYTSTVEKIALKHNENSFRLELAVMDYAMDNLVEFSYKLQGLDADWIFLGNEKNLDFRNIPFGDYELRIRTRLKNGAWSSDYQRVFIAIAAPFYLSKWAVAAYVLFGALLAFVLIFFYSRKIKAEAELRVKEAQLQQEEHLYTERLNFYTNITHELRTPLTLILGPLDDLLQEDKLELKQRGLLQMVQKSANRLFALVNQLLEFRKVESQHKALILGEGYLADMLREIVCRYAELNSKKNVHISAEMPAVDIHTAFDAEIVQLIIDNLMANAYKYTDKGYIKLRLEYQEEALSNWALITVEDSGIGIAADQLDKIFDKFYQIQRPAMQGTGVGLALVKELAAIHYGRISVSSTLGQGSIFSVRLLANRVHTNLAVSMEPKKGSGDEPLSETQRPLVLLVEDDADLRSYLSASLRLHYEVLTAENGLLGLELAVKHIPDLVLSDVMMPDMDGFQLLEKLKAKRETSHIPVVFLTAKDTELDRRKGYDLGADSYLNKPVSGQLLQRRIENLLLKRKSVYTEILHQLSASNTPEEQTAEKMELWRENAFVQDFVRIVEQHIQDEVLDAATLSDKMNMSQSTLYRKLKGITGKNINQLVRKVRIQKAAELLRSGNHNITEVAFMVGINSAIYFRQCFKEEFGQLPSEFVKMQGNRS